MQQRFHQKCCTKGGKVHELIESGFLREENKKIPALPFVQLMWREYIITE